MAGSGGAPALAQDFDAKHHGGMPPYATCVARTIFMHTLALRAASTRNLEAGFELTFADGLSMAGDAAETFTERLSRFAGGAAYVSATAHAAES